ncbi:hypothetical protein RVR_8281 [Actinacidiphila reveromycinica]|uniref:Uncharacterized protein n=1 Tax=Actinacidiphila reveromycinica TaxID=659352 RepID=A0A7U3UYM3_9ACTN|nr:hypothetical protein [Streptomyces sp. SN-593]BBB01047.1 hypothetical protein RVR_8281 [Streptomyces sp. SN-593]
MALCPGCDGVIPCHCHLQPPVQTRPGVYLAVPRMSRAEVIAALDALTAADMDHANASLARSAVRADTEETQP